MIKTVWLAGMERPIKQVFFENKRFSDWLNNVYLNFRLVPYKVAHFWDLSKTWLSGSERFILGRFRRWESKWHFPDKIHQACLVYNYRFGWCLGRLSTSCNLWWRAKDAMGWPGAKTFLANSKVSSFSLNNLRPKVQVPDHIKIGDDFFVWIFYCDFLLVRYELHSLTYQRVQQGQGCLRKFVPCYLRL